MSPGHEGEGVPDLTVTSLALLSTPHHSTALLVTAVAMTPTSDSTHSFLIAHHIADTPPSKVASVSPQAKGTAQPHPVSQVTFEPLDTYLAPLPDEVPFDVPSPLPVLPYYPPTHSSPSSSSPPHNLLANTSTGIRIIPLSKLLPDLHGNYRVQQMHPLPTSQLLAVYAIRARPHPLTDTEVKGDDEQSTREVKGQDNAHGCLVLLRYGVSGEEGRVCLFPETVVRLVTVCSGDVIVDMCGVSVSGDKSCDMMAVVMREGEMKLLDVESLQVRDGGEGGEGGRERRGGGGRVGEGLRGRERMMKRRRGERERGRGGAVCVCVCVCVASRQRYLCVCVF